MTLALLLTAATGAWADETPLVTITFGYSGPVYSESGIVTVTGSNADPDYNGGKYSWSPTGTIDLMSATVEVAAGYNITKVVFWSNDNGNYVSALEDTAEPYVCYSKVSSDGKSLSDDLSNKVDGYNIAKIEVYGTYEPPLEVAWNTTTKTGTFTMPGSDVVLTPRYASATIYQNDGETEKQAYETLKEAIANVQDGDVIKLDWDVTSDGDIDTPDADVNNPVHFTLDLNGRSININEFTVHNYVATFTDSSEGQTGRFKCDEFWGIGDASAYYFDSGTYFFHGDAAHYNDFFANPENRFYLTEGKEFVDVEKVDDGFYLRIDWKAFELTIGKDRFATFYAAQNVALDAEQAAAGVGLYTISNVNADRSEAAITALTGVVEAGLPILVYNGTDAQQTVKLKGTNAASNENNPTPAEEFMGTAIAKTFTEDDMAAADYYALSGGKLFVPVYDAGTIGKNQCWLQFNHANGAPARGITLVFEKEEATEVTEVSEVNEVSDDSWYDLSGRKLDGEPTEKGVYILNGKKVVIK